MGKKVTAKKVTAKNKVKAKTKSVKKSAPAKKAVKKAKPAAKKAAPKKSVKKAAKPVAKAKVNVKAKTVKKAAAKVKTKLAAKKPAAVKATAFKAPTAKPSAKIDYSKAITPLGDRLVIRLVQAERVTPGGLILPDSVSSTSGYLKGEVLAAGHGTYTKKGHHRLLDVKIGDVVLFSEYSSTKVKFNNEDLHIVHENEVLGVAE